MNKILKWIGIALAFPLCLGLLGGGFLFLHFPRSIPIEKVDAGQMPERIDRGRYLALHVSVCLDCHSTRDWTHYSGPMVPGTEGKGGERFDHGAGIPGEVIAPNLTPRHLAEWSDGEILRSFTAGLKRSGDALFPLMPYLLYSQMDREDALAIISYIRTLKGIDSVPSESKLDFPMNLIVRTIPVPAPARKKPPVSDSLAYGKYVATIAGCIECHTPSEKGQHMPGMDFAGGFRFGFPNGVARSANITPDVDTGIGSWTEESFVRRFKSTVAREMKPDEVNTPMPWTMYAGMTDEDLGAIYKYLRTVAPVRNQVEHFKSGERIK